MPSRFMPGGPDHGLAGDPFAAMTGASRRFLQAVAQARRLRGTGATVLLTGETGVGKENFAQAIHRWREGADAPIVALNCGAIAGSLAESELFGYERGAFSGADPRGKPGKIALAQGGTLFLDEIGELSPDMQVKLLRVLEERAYFPLGGTRTLQADCRFIAATNRNLETEMRQGRFREDLYYRLNAVALDIPPLRHRREDIAPLADRFLREFAERYDRQLPRLSAAQADALRSYDWPGNIRELRNAAERLVVFSEDGIPDWDGLPAAIRRMEKLPVDAVIGKEISHDAAARDAVPGAGQGEGDPDDSMRLPESGTLPEWLGEYERRLIHAAIRESGGNKQAAAQRLGISRVSLYNKLGNQPDRPKLIR